MQTISSSLLALLALILLPALAAAQSQFPPPANPVTICGTQAAPVADSYQLVFDGAAPEAVTLGAPVSACPPGSTHSFTLPAARFSVGTHSIKLLPTNAFGTNATSIAYAVSVGIAPGQFTVTAVVPG